MSWARKTGPGSAEIEEINTKELAQRISAELKRYSIPQAIFAQRVLCRSQGTLSDLLRNPKPWSKLKSGRETFRRMWKWLQEPEFQRMSALRLAVRRTVLEYINYGVRSRVWTILDCLTLGLKVDGHKVTTHVPHTCSESPFLSRVIKFLASYYRGLATLQPSSYFPCIPGNYGYIPTIKGHNKIPLVKLPKPNVKQSTKVKVSLHPRKTQRNVSIYIGTGYFFYIKRI
ncbi:hypothetical protein B566_EDAN013469 [Ephemera danica]|nr:hypothetical protein B566_EDAN013469 [Ephemera danica]